MPHPQDMSISTFVLQMASLITTPTKDWALTSEVSRIKIPIWDFPEAASTPPRKLENGWPSPSCEIPGDILAFCTLALESKVKKNTLECTKLKRVNVTHSVVGVLSLVGDGLANHQEDLQKMGQKFNKVALKATGMHLKASTCRMCFFYSICSWKKIESI